jgi:hypothetical protein
MNKQRIDPALAAEQARTRAREAAAAKDRIATLVSRVPPRVLSGSFNVVVQWKAEATRAQSLAARQRVSLEHLRAAVVMLEQFE